MRIEFFVHGTPKPAGSKRGFVNPKTGKAILVDASGQKGKDWRHDCKMAAVDAMNGKQRFIGPVKLTVNFCMPRPKAHYKGKTASLKTNAPRWHTKTPDSTKLLRGLEDSLKGIVWDDDSQVAVQYVLKQYDGDTNGAFVLVEDLI